MRHPGLLDRNRAVLVLIDLQEGYRSVLHGWEPVAAACALLVRGARLLGVPLLVTEQYPRGIGHTATQVATHFPAGLVAVQKMTMSCCGATSFVDGLRALDRNQILVAGIETHACVNQTVHDLIALGYQVHVARDATSSRHCADVEPAWDKMRSAGMLPTSSEQALLELVRTAESPEFKALQQLLKEEPAPSARPLGG
jgi:nicotinamidase-related amidase